MGGPCKVNAGFARLQGWQKASHDEKRECAKCCRCKKKCVFKEWWKVLKVAEGIENKKLKLDLIVKPESSLVPLILQTGNQC